ncbi:MAG: hypothetical protein ACR2QF_07220 [Geminicoccaceae bacterium]
MAAYATQDVIAEALGIDRNTLAKHYPDELQVGKARATAEVATTLYEKAISPEMNSASVSAATFWLRTAGKWKIVRDESPEGTGFGQQPAIQQNNFVQIDVRGLPSDELRAIASLSRRAESAGGEGGS